MGKKILRSILIALLLTGIAVILIGCSIAIPSFDPSKLNIEYKTSTIYDINDKEIMTFQAVPGEPAKLNEIPKQTRDALVAVEDNRFYDHNGIDFRAVARAVYRDIITRSAAEGGSTLTQQLARNVYLTQEKTMTRKVKEIALAAQIERNFSKDDILEMYLNRMYFGQGAYGVKAAAEVYFDKGDRMQDLTLAEAAMLAGVLNAPTAYNPYINMDLATQRRNIVLGSMEKYGYITEEERAKAEAEPITLKRGRDIKGMDQTGRYPYYFDHILQEAEEQLDIPAEQIMRGGVKVYTNLDPNIQEALESAYTNPRNFPSNAADGTWAQAASVVLNPKTGGIVALVGGRDQGDHVFRGFNRVSQAQVRPGSSIKPIVAYAPAIDTGFITSASKLNNKEETEFPGGYKPRNWNDKYSDTVTVTEALRNSLNVPTASLLYDLGIEKGYNYATEKFGLDLAEEDRTKLGIALGDVNVTPLNMAEAYTAFANDGVRVTGHAIRKVISADGATIGELESKKVKAIKPETAKVMTRLLMDTVRNGTGSTARISGRDVAGKTGTTEMEGIKSGNRDSWFAGYTPEFVMVTWMGFDNTDNQHYLRESSGVPAALFSKVMGQALKNYPPSRFDTAVVEKPVEEEEEDNKAIVKDLSATLDGNVGQITWSPVEEKGVKYFLYRAEKQADGKATNSVALGEFTKPGYTDQLITAGKTYLYSVVVFKDGKELSVSNFAQLAVPGQKEPEQPEPPKTPDTTDPNKPNDGQPGDTGTPTTPTVPTPTTPTTPSTGGNNGGGTDTGTGGNTGGNTNTGGTNTGGGTGDGTGTGGNTGGVTTPTPPTTGQ